MSTPRLLHVAAQVDAPGGMGGMIRRHRAREPRSRFIGYFDRPRGRGPGATDHLGGRGGTTPRELRRRFIATIGTDEADVAVHHNAWALPWFVGLDRCARRVAYLHTDLPRFEAFVSSMRGLVDGVVCLNRETADDCVGLLGLEPGRVLALTTPVDPPADLGRGPSGSPPIRIGYAGRLDLPQKRLDRTAAFLAGLDTVGVDWTFEFLGDGRYRPVLERRFRGDQRVSFAGWRSGHEYWQRLAAWDAIVSFSDYEAGPITQAEAMALGVLPIFPRLRRTQGAEDAAAVDARCVYPAGDVGAAARQLKEIFAQPPERLATWRGRATAIVAGRTGAQYHHDFDAWIGEIARRERISSDTPRRSRGSDLLPMGLVRRLFPSLLLS